MIAELPNLDRILDRHKIPPTFWPQLHALVEEGQRPSGELLRRLNHVTKYKAAMKEILAELSRGLEHTFPPPDYQSPVPYESLRPKSQVPYESLRAEDIESEGTVLRTLAGAPSVAR